jgi:hypothetical protein
MSIKDYALTDNQREVVSLREQGLSFGQIAKTMGKDKSNVSRAYYRCKERAAKQGYSPDHDMNHTVPYGYTVKGVSTLYNQEGEISAQWVKSTQEKKETAVAALLESLEKGEYNFKKFKPVAGPKNTEKDLCSLLTITDFHIGMYSWNAETSEDWNVNISREVFLNAVNDLLERSPDAEIGILNQLGDFLHWDGLVPVTPTSQHILEGTDSRYPKLVDMAMTVMVEAVRLMLKKYKKVVVVQAEGNHDISGSIWLRKFLKHMFENEPRVEVIDNEFPYYAYLHGEILIAFHHGHKTRINQLHKVFSAEPRFRSLWGQATNTYIHTGHYHHERVYEDAGAIAEQHPTLAARDSYATRLGLVSARGAKIITYHKKYGETHRVTVRPREN